MLSKSTLLKYYKRRDVQDALVNHAHYKEIGVRYGDGFGKRPDILPYPRDVLELALRGCTSFHCSEENWFNPLDISSNLKRKELDELRKGWDLVLDIDCAILEYSKICGHLIVEFLKYCGVKDISVKFSVTGDTPILVRINNQTQLVPIEKVVEKLKSGKRGEVLSLDKNLQVCFSKITGYLEHKEEIYEIYHKNSKLPLRATKYHSVFVWNKGEILEKEVEKLQKGDFLITFTEGKKLQKKSRLFRWNYEFRGKVIHEKIKITEGIILLLGYYLAEGHLTKTIHQIGFTFNVNEIDYIKECITLLENLTDKTVSIRHPNPNSTQILIHSKKWYAFFEKLCGKGAKNKHIPEIIWSRPKKHFLQLLTGYLRGDGHKRNRYSITTKSVSHQLIREIVWLCKLFGISCSLNQEFTKEHRLPQGTMFKGSHVYTFNIPRSELTGTEFFSERSKFSPFPADKTFPIDGLKAVYKQIKPKRFNHFRAEQMTLSKKSANILRIKKVLDWFEKTKSVEYSQESYEIVKNYQRLFNSEITALEITDISLQNEEMVYDISVKGTERFFGGEYPILLHNSGNKGFHIALPFEAFPSMIGDTKTKDLFPEAPRKIAFYIKENIKEELGKRIIAFERGDFGKVRERVDLPQSDIIRYEKNEMGGEVAKLNVDPFLEIDTVLLSSRHLFRMPYSLHEKSGLASIPIDPESVLLFEKPMAEPEKVVPTMIFMKRDVEESARRLLMRALDFEVKLEEERVEKTYEEIDIKSPITQEFFPPCVQKILGGLEDGKKRAVFIMMNFLGKIGWSKEEIELYLKEWNKKNPEPLREVYFNGQLHSFEAGAKLPPNCDNEAYCKGIGVCEPDNFCKYIKNPVNYTILKWRRVIRQQEQDKMKKESKNDDSSNEVPNKE